MHLLITSGLDPSSMKLTNALEGLYEAWDTFYDEVTDTEQNTPLTVTIIYKPKDSVIQILLYLQTL